MVTPSTSLPIPIPGSDGAERPNTSQTAGAGSEAAQNGAEDTRPFAAALGHAVVHRRNSVPAKAGKPEPAGRSAGKQAERDSPAEPTGSMETASMAAQTEPTASATNGKSKSSDPPEETDISGITVACAPPIPVMGLPLPAATLPVPSVPTAANPPNPVLSVPPMSVAKAVPMPMPKTLPTPTAEVSSPAMAATNGAAQQAGTVSLLMPPTIPVASAPGVPSGAQTAAPTSVTLPLAANPFGSPPVVTAQTLSGVPRVTAPNLSSIAPMDSHVSQIPLASGVGDASQPAASAPQTSSVASAAVQKGPMPGEPKAPGAAAPAPTVAAGSPSSGAPHAENASVLSTPPETSARAGATSAPAPLPAAAQRLDSMDRLLATGDLPVARATVSTPNAPESRQTTATHAQEVPASVRPAVSHIAAADPAAFDPANAQTTVPDTFGPEPTQPLTPPPFALSAANPMANAKGAGVPTEAEATANVTQLTDRALPSPAGAVSPALTNSEDSETTGQGHGGGGDTHDAPQPQPKAHPTSLAPNAASVEAARQSASRVALAPASAPTVYPGLTAERARIVEQVTRHLETMRLTNGRGEITLRLQPESLGSLHITVASRADGVMAHIITQTEQVQHVMAAAHEELRTALESKGLRLHGLEVSVGQGAVSDGRTAFGSPYQTPQERAETAYGRSYARPVAPPVEARETVAPLPTPSALRGRHSASRLDYRA